MKKIVIISVSIFTLLCSLSSFACDCQKNNTATKDEQKVENNSK